MDKEEEIKQAEKFFKVIKSAHASYNKIPRTLKFLLSFAVLRSVREIIREHDESEDVKDFLEVLLDNIGGAIYMACKVYFKEES